MEAASRARAAACSNSGETKRAATSEASPSKHCAPFARVMSTMEGNNSSWIARTIAGNTTIRFRDIIVKRIGPLCCHDVWMYYCGMDAHSVKATMLVFNNATQGGSGSALCHNLTSLACSPHVLRVYACVEGTGTRGLETYVAFQYFNQTFASFMEDGISVENERFSEAFIGILGDVVKGLLFLHNNGFYCPMFHGSHIAVIDNGQLSAKIWHFSATEEAKAKDGNWICLAYMIEVAAKVHNIYDLDIEDLVQRIKAGELKGLEILKHIALLSDHDRRDQILAVSCYVETFCPSDQPRTAWKQHPFLGDPIKTHLHDDLVSFLYENIGWLANLPAWIRHVNNNRVPRIVLPKMQTGRSLLFQLRSMLEHANLYIPPTDPNTNTRPTLLNVFSQAWGKYIFRLHKYATGLGLKY